LMDVSFRCDCGAAIDSIISVPEPNYQAERHADATVEAWETIPCEDCATEHEVHIMSALTGADISVNRGETEIRVSGPYYPEEMYTEANWYLYTDSHYVILRRHLDSVNTLINVKVPAAAEFSMLVMAHGHIVSAVEGYLAGTFIHEVTRSDELIKKLVEVNRDLGKQRFSLNEIYIQSNNLKITVATYLKNLIFHDLKRVIPIYRDVLGHDFGDLRWLFNGVKLRHDCVHRAGYNKDGEPVNITKNTLIVLLERVTALVESVEETVRAHREQEK